MVTKYNINNFEKDCFGENEEVSTNFFNFNSNKSAYILFYDKIIKKDLKFHFNKDNLLEKNKILSCLIDKDKYKFEKNTFTTNFYNIGKYKESNLIK